MVTNTNLREPIVIEARRVRDAADISDIVRLADLLDTKFVVPGTNWRFGLDSIIGLVPGIGDLVTTGLGAYIIYRARELGAPGWLIARMTANLAIDGVIGAIPLVGDVFDFAFRSNAKNVRMLRRYLEKRTLRDVTP
ncbi:DUF4112 domain-containing protein [Terricaulis sp.]|uniref:DUF4112 domain-containing protein n=1 Tax=Terricaulis sp. TaxID=2768686 RepID=UPI002AC56A09|nr:DUF4112 domain-containing protein [Terricaulis sp.]MDZ4690756.1 DUF4112 domain-containing protein [Terricaulis sp.]